MPGSVLDPGDKVVNKNTLPSVCSSEMRLKKKIKSDASRC